jgi:hypothetical protein
MNITRDELIDLLDELCGALGEIVAAHAELSESLLDVASQQQQEKLARLKTKMSAEKAKLEKMRNASKRRRELKGAGKG